MQRPTRHVDDAVAIAAVLLLFYCFAIPSGKVVPQYTGELIIDNGIVHTTIGLLLY